MADRLRVTPREELLTQLHGLYFEWMRDPEPAVLEPRLQRVVDLITSHPAARDEIVEVLLALALVWPPSAIEVLEYTMASLRWPEVEEALHQFLHVTADLERRRPADRVLLAYEDPWPNEHLYPAFNAPALQP